MEQIISVEALQAAYGSGAFDVVAGFLVSSMVAAMRWMGLGHVLQKATFRWVALGAGALAGIILGLMAKAQPIDTLGPAVAIGLAAIGQWELIIGPLAKKMGVQPPTPGGLTQG